MYEYRIKSVDHIVDGDTFDCTIDLGFNISHKIRVRMYGINTPESRTRDLEEKALGLAAKARLTELITEATEVHNDQLFLRTKEKGKFGRYLGEIYRGVSRYDDGTPTFNMQLVAEGHAIEYYGGKR